MEYRIAKGYTVNELEHVVKDLLREGWAPLGSLVVEPKFAYSFLQPMIRLPKANNYSENL